MNETYDIYPSPSQHTVVSVAEQIRDMNYQYMRMTLIMSAILFIYVCANYYFRDRNEWYIRNANAFDAGCLVASLFLLVVSIIYFTGWM